MGWRLKVACPGNSPALEILESANHRPVTQPLPAFVSSLVNSAVSSKSVHPFRGYGRRNVLRYFGLAPAHSRHRLRSLGFGGGSCHVNIRWDKIQNKPSLTDQKKVFSGVEEGSIQRWGHWALAKTADMSDGGRDSSFHRLWGVRPRLLGPLYLGREEQCAPSVSSSRLPRNAGNSAQAHSPSQPDFLGNICPGGQPAAGPSFSTGLRFSPLPSKRKQFGSTAT